MREPDPGEMASLFSELLLYHMALGRGYVSPFDPEPRGMVYTACLGQEAILSMGVAEMMFHEWHASQLEEARKALGEAKARGAARSKYPDERSRYQKLKEKLAKLPFVTCRNEQTSKSRLIVLLVRNFYGAMGFLDQVGARLAGSLGGIRLAEDLTWPTLMGGSTDSTLIRSSYTGNFRIHSLLGLDTVFTHLCAADDSLLKTLVERIRESSTGAPGIGSTLVIRRVGDPKYSGVKPDTLFDMMRRVYSQGEREPEHRTRVEFSGDSIDDWKAFLSSDAQMLLGRGQPLTDWEQDQLRDAPATPELCAGMSARAVMTLAFVQALEQQKNGPLSVVTLTAEHLSLAQRFARLVYATSSGATAIEQRRQNLKGGGATHYLSEARVIEALHAFKEAVSKAESGRITRSSVRNIPSLTHGTLDELVKRGDILELRGVGVKRTGGGRQRSYALPAGDNTNDPEESMQGSLAAEDAYRDHPEMVPMNEAAADGTENQLVP